MGCTRAVGAYCRIASESVDEDELDDEVLESDLGLIASCRLDAASSDSSIGSEHSVRTKAMNSLVSLKLREADFSLRD